MKSFILIPLVILLFSACHKSDGPAVTKPTQSGQNIIAFTVDDQQHLYTGVPTFFSGGITFSIIKNADSSMIIYMGGTVANYKDGFDLAINVPRFSLSSVYHIGNNYPYYQSSYNNTDANGRVDIFYPDSSKSSFIFTRLDSLVGAGTFQYYGVDSNGETVTLTNGFFDIANPFK